LTLWSLAPLLSALGMMILGLLVLLRRGTWRGRILLAFVAVASLIDLLCLSAVLSGWSVPPEGLAARLLMPASLVLGSVLVFLSLRFGQDSARTTVGDRILAFLGLAVPLLLLIWGSIRGGLTWAESRQDGLTLTLGTPPGRGLMGFLLLVGALGILRFQALRIAARRARLKVLGRAATGLLLGSLGLFLHAAQALLYGGAALHVLALGSLGLIPACVLLLAFLRAPADERRRLPHGLPLVSSSLVLMGLGVYLIALAVMGQVIHRYLPARGILWFHWGSAVLLLTLSSLMLVPGLRQRLVAWFGPGPNWSAGTNEEMARLGQGLIPGEPFSSLLVRIGPRVESMLGRTGMALWVLDPPGGSLRPVSLAEAKLPALGEQNPLRRACREAKHVLDLSDPPSRVDQLPIFAENVDLIERLGFRIFVRLVDHGTELGLLGLAPRERHLESEDSLFVERIGDALSTALAATLQNRSRATDQRPAAAGGSGPGPGAPDKIR
jgi:hypothetical protein